ncbi:peptidyl-prolyl cis-trans isomerase FKBP4 isoform X2 [Phymastichus coffea]|nr:peptidyl-prolyl cis-trans isomerase FKBP4 isoform X2 [Phymastichus coffea]
MAVDITPQKNGGVLKEIIEEGVGERTPGVGAHVEVHYTGVLLDGTPFDSSKDRNETFKFDLGKGRVIKGWDIGVATMKKGEVADLICAPDYAYGDIGSPPKIPPNSTLKFRVELIDWEGEDLSPDKDKSIVRDIIKAGEGFLTPAYGSLLEVHVKGFYDGLVFEDRDVKFPLGEGEADGIVEGLEIALEKFKKGEISSIKLKSKYAFKEAGKPEYKVPPCVDVEYEVELKSFEEGPQAWSMDPNQKIEKAIAYKEKGTTYFKNNQYSLAIKMYKKVMEYINEDFEFKDMRSLRDTLLLNTNLNLAMCYLKLKDGFEAKEACNKALELEPKNIKAHFRRGMAYLELASPEIAIKDFQEVLKLEPKNPAAVKQVAICNDIIKKELAKEKKLYANMFDKFAKQDQK